MNQTVIGDCVSRKTSADEEKPPKVKGKPAVLVEGSEHYKKLSPQPIEVIKKWKLDFCLGNVIKYVARAGHKSGESAEDDLKKARHYIDLYLTDFE
jgi:hypothetical protein